MPVAVLFARADSVYKTMPGCDVYDEARDARTWPGGAPVVAHPPCRLWAKLRQFAKARDPEAERMLAVRAVRAVREFGGVLEHPAESTLWAHCGLPLPGRAPDDHGGWTAEVRQCDWGHKAEKLTWLYIVGVHPDDLPPLPPRGEPTGVIKPQRGVPRTLKIVTKAEREHTPPELAAWLVETARRAASRSAGINPRLSGGQGMVSSGTLLREGTAGADVDVPFPRAGGALRASGNAAGRPSPVAGVLWGTVELEPLVDREERTTFHHDPLPLLRTAS